MTTPARSTSIATPFWSLIEQYVPDLKAANGADEEYRGRCPNPDHEHGNRKNPAFVVNRKTRLWYCHACGAKGGRRAFLDFIAKHKLPPLPLSTNNGQPAASTNNGQPAGGEGVHTPPGITASLQSAAPSGCTLAQYGTAKRLPIKFLRGLGLRDISYPLPSGKNISAVKIPFFDVAGRPQGAQFRLALAGPQKLVSKARKSKQDELGFYGLEIHQQIAQAGGCFLVEGPSCWQTLWHHGLPALALPGKSMWRACWARCPDEIKALLRRVEVYLWREPDALTLPETVARDLPDLRVIRPPAGVKDASALHLHPKIDGDRALFVHAMDGLRRQAVTMAEYTDRENEQRRRAEWAVCRELARQPNILDKVADVMVRSGLAREQRAAKTVYLAATSVRFLPKPISVLVKGQSASGKNDVLGRALALIPLEHQWVMSGLSERALVYNEEQSLMYRSVVLPESTALGMPDDVRTSLVRTLLSEGRLVYDTVEKTADGLKSREIVRPGPANLLSTTTKFAVDPELETRLLSVPVDESPEQTSLVNAQQLQQAERGVLQRATDVVAQVEDLRPWHALQRYLALRRPLDVVIPYARHLQPPPAAVRLRRDVPTMLAAIQTHAALHLATRKKTPSGAVIARLADYTAVRGLIGDFIAVGVQKTVPPDVRKAYHAVERLVAVQKGKGWSETNSPERYGVTAEAVATKLKVDSSTGWRWVQKCARLHYLKNLETQKYRPARWIPMPGRKLPEDQPLWPEPSDVARDYRQQGRGRVLAGLQRFRGGNPGPPPTTRRRVRRVPRPILKGGAR